jgi:hypothetical protein
MILAGEKPKYSEENHVGMLTLTTASSEVTGLRSNQGPGCETQALHRMGRPSKYERVISVY